jgi:hypothetical protein
MHLSTIALRTMGFALLACLAAGCGGEDGEGKTPVAQLTGQDGNGLPSIQGSPARSVLVGRAYSFQPTATDPNDDPLTFSATNLPPWAAFNATTGRLSGTPTNSDVGTYTAITITVSDGKANASLPAFSINVTATATGAATLSWTPPTQNSDGSALTNLAGYHVLFGQSEDALDQMIELDNPSLSTYVVDNLTSGTWYFAVLSMNATGVASRLSNVTSKTIS